MSNTSKNNKAYSEEQAQFICENYRGRGNIELAEMFNNKFGTFKTARQINSWKKRRNLNSGLTGYFEKGSIPANKGTKGMFNFGGNSTSFKKGNKPSNYKPVGYERIDRDGYILVKVQDHGSWNERWRAKHRVVYEEEIGPIPKGKRLVFLNGNSQDIRLDNLMLVSNAVGAVMNKQKLYSSNPDETRAAALIASLKVKISRIENEERKKVK